MKTFSDRGALLAASTSSVLAKNMRDSLPGMDMLPEGAVQISPVVPAMGEHWAKPAELPLGPIYRVYEGKIVRLEFMVSREDLAAGKPRTRRPRRSPA
ncbi:MAG TPA: hypothetical protein VFR34_01505, partial [Paracoccaceae bacterium]|nr:hypothetical protein [Paracoccaceae bacterium]